MTLSDAIRMLGTSAGVSSRSDAALALDVSNRQRALIRKTPGLASKSTVVEAAGLNAGLAVRPISALLELARGTALNEDPDIVAVARRWPVLRHLGIFACDPSAGRLTLDGAALGYIGPNQRRVLSEELGIGFGILAGKIWCRDRNPGIGPIAVVDVDKALHNGLVPDLKRNGPRQPDYLLAYANPNGKGTVFELLETKGTVSPSNAREQLARAVTQLAGLTVLGRSITGLATSTVSSERGISLLAVDPDEPPFVWIASDEKLRDSRTKGERARTDEQRIDVDADEFFASASNVDKASLADFAGQYQTATQWLPSLGGRRQGRGNVQAHRENEAGEFIGIEFVAQDPATGQRIRLFQGVEAGIVEALNYVDSERVVGAQQSFAQTEAVGRDGQLAIHEPNDSVALAISTEGAMLEIRAD